MAEIRKRKSTRKNDERAEGSAKLELAENIARNSKRVRHTYANLENSLAQIFHWLSGVIDRFLFNQKFGKFAALVLAIILYIAVNGDNTSANTIATSSGATFSNVQVQVIYNSDAYEISGIPDTVSCTVLGEASDIQLIRSQNTYRVQADLTGLTEGEHSVSLTPIDFSNRLTVTVNPTNVIVTIKKKVTQKFRVSSQYINTNQMNSIYTLSENPTLDTTEVSIRASEDTIAKIGYVKALIDVTGVTQNFEATATVVAYDNEGNRMDVDIFPSTVTASVEVSAPQKEVPISIVPVGEIPDGNAIDQITLDHSTVIVYAPQSVLDQISSINVEIDATKINKDSSWTYAIDLPSGVTALSVNKVNINVQIAQAETRVITNVPVLYANNTNGYAVVPVNQEDAVQSITITGTAKNINAITSADIQVLLDMSNVQPGNNQSLPIIVTGSNDLVTYTLTSGATTLKCNVTEE